MSYDLFRLELSEVDDAGDTQRIKARGVAGEELTGVHRVQPFGFHSMPPAGSHGLGLALHGQRDLVAALGVESAQHRPKSREAGSTVIYDHNGNAVSIVQGKTRVTHSQAVEVQVGSVLFKITSAGVDISGGYIKHNGKRIDADHTHGDVMPGSGTSGAPNN